MGLQNRTRFEKGIFRSLSAARANLTRGGRAAVSFVFFRIRGHRRKCPRGCGAEGFAVFFGFLFDPVFANLKWSSSHPPLFLWGFFSFVVRILLGIGGNAALHVCFWAVGLQPFLVFCVFWSFYKNTVFPLKTGCFVHFSVSPLLGLGFFHFSFFTLCLSLPCFLLFVFLPCYLVYFVSSLFFCCSFLSCFFAFVSRKKTTSNITFERFLFINYFCFGGGVLFCFVFQIPVIIFVKGRFWGQIWLMFEKHCKNRHFSTRSRAL